MFGFFPESFNVSKSRETSEIREKAEVANRFPEGTDFR